MLSAFAMSSIWHGIEPGYAFFFFFLFLNAVGAKLMMQTQLCHAVAKRVPWPILAGPLWVWNFFQLSYAGMPFVWLHWSTFDAMHANFGYFWHWFYPIYLLVAYALPKRKRSKVE